MKNEYTESNIATKFGEFNIRVYAASKGQETVVLWKHQPSSMTLPPLIRVHSECLTGDTFGGLNCDCGKQLAKALAMINKEGGALIYLRQEGRGIGLFEKIRSYRFQKQGYDTFEANVVLGHRPDERTYEMAGKALRDLNIQRIRLLTNNPAKISELAKFGIEITERVPLITKPNKHNHAYFNTKREKFGHSFNQKIHQYFYQFHANTSGQVKIIGEFLKDKRQDPLLTICVGIVATHANLKDKKAIKNFYSIYKACASYGFIPVLHFSFSNSIDVLQDLREIKHQMPFVNRLQINDMPSTNLFHWKFASSLFSLDIPFSDENMDSLHNKKIRTFIKQKKAFALLDNSRGQGIQEPKEILMNKIEILLGYGINHIGIFGGFGPNELQTFFDLRGYYHINFSIDAETKLKTNGEIDLEKTKKYLLQLMCFENELSKNLRKTKPLLTVKRSTGIRRKHAVMVSNY